MAGSSKQAPVKFLMVNPATPRKKPDTRSARISQQQWMVYKDRIADWYQTHTAFEILDFLREEGIHSSEDQLRLQLKSWGIKKCIPSKTYKRKAGNDFEGSNRENGSRVSMSMLQTTLEVSKPHSPRLDGLGIGLNQKTYGIVPDIIMNATPTVIVPFNDQINHPEAYFDDFVNLNYGVPILQRVFQDVAPLLDRHFMSSTLPHTIKTCDLRSNLLKMSECLIKALSRSETSGGNQMRPRNRFDLSGIRDAVQCVRQDLSESEFIQFYDGRQINGAEPQPRKLKNKRLSKSTQATFVENDSSVRWMHFKRVIYPTSEIDDDNAIVEQEMRLTLTMKNELEVNGLELVCFQRMWKNIKYRMNPILKVHSVRNPQDWKDIIGLISCGDLEGIKERFSKKALSPMDLGPCGSNLIQAALCEVKLQPSIIELFIQQGVDANYMSTMGGRYSISLSPFDHLYNLHTDEIAFSLGRQEYLRNRRLVARLLLGAGAEVALVHMIDNYVFSASFWEVLQYGDIEDFQILLEESYENNIIDLNDLKDFLEHDSAFLCFLGHIEFEHTFRRSRTAESCVKIVNLLISHGALINVRNRTDGVGALHRLFMGAYAFRDYEEEGTPTLQDIDNFTLPVLKSLINAGADMYANDAFLYRTLPSYSHICVGTVTEAAYMSGLQKAWWNALIEQGNRCFDKDTFLETQACSRGLSLADYKDHLQSSWNLFRRLGVIDRERFRHSESLCQKKDLESSIGFDIEFHTDDMVDGSIINSTESHPGTTSQFERNIKHPDHTYLPSPHILPVDTCIGNLQIMLDDEVCYFHCKHELQDYLSAEGKEYMEILSFQHQPSAENIIFRLYNGWVLSTYLEPDGSVTAKPYAFNDDILDDREDLVSGWFPQMDKEPEDLYLLSSSQAPIEWLLKPLEEYICVCTDWESASEVSGHSSCLGSNEEEDEEGRVTACTQRNEEEADDQDEGPSAGGKDKDDTERDEEIKYARRDREKRYYEEYGKAPCACLLPNIEILLRSALRRMIEGYEQLHARQHSASQDQQRSEQDI